MNNHLNVNTECHCIECMYADSEHIRDCSGDCADCSIVAPYSCMECDAYNQEERPNTDDYEH